MGCHCTQLTLSDMVARDRCSESESLLLAHLHPSFIKILCMALQRDVRVGCSGCSKVHLCLITIMDLMSGLLEAPQYRLISNSVVYPGLHQRQQCAPLATSQCNPKVRLALRSIFSAPSGSFLKSDGTESGLKHAYLRWHGSYVF